MQRRRRGMLTMNMLMDGVLMMPRVMKLSLTEYVVGIGGGVSQP